LTAAMNVVVAVLGGGPGGYTVAIRAAQLGARVACIEREPELGGTCLRIGCIPAKAWAQTALALKQAGQTAGRLGVRLGILELDFPAANAWKARVVRRMTQGVAFLFQANGVTWIKGTGTFTDLHTLAVDGGEDVTFRSAIIATGSFRCARRSRASARNAASTPKGCSPRPRSHGGWSSWAVGSSGASSRRSSSGSGAR
jgi:pyruvate/2-oxoglutarate dehydrogenase complex dihydrolipoamide dehydrogenase (E3) component